MHLFKKKRVFPNNWSDLSQEHVLENVRYLLKNYKKYNICLPRNNIVRIDNVRIQRKEVQILRYTFDVYEINKRMVTVDSDIGHSVTELIRCCEHSEREQGFREKFKKWKKGFTENTVNQRLRN